MVTGMLKDEHVGYIFFIKKKQIQSSWCYPILFLVFLEYMLCMIYLFFFTRELFQCFRLVECIDGEDELDNCTDPWKSEICGHDAFDDGQT